MRIMGLDFGSKTIGVAISDELGITAFGLEIIRRADDKSIKKSVARIGEIIGEYGITTVVLGYPKHLDNSESSSSLKTQEFKERLERNFKKLNILLWDERYTTVEARRALKDAGLNSQKIGGVVDKIAAIFILQSYLDSQKTNDNYETEENARHV